MDQVFGRNADGFYNVGFTRRPSNKTPNLGVSTVRPARLERIPFGHRFISYFLLFFGLIGRKPSESGKTDYGLG
jgi:hypothetical protein